MALCIFLLRYRLWEGPPEKFRWEGDTGTVVGSLDNGLTKKASFLDNIFDSRPADRGTDLQNHLRDLMGRKNTEQKTDRRLPISMWIRSDRFPQRNASFYADGKLLVGTESWRKLLTGIEKQWKRHGNAGPPKENDSPQPLSDLDFESFFGQQKQWEISSGSGSFPNV
jgi:hypothetical protein